MTYQCANCGRDMPELEAAIDETPYCHPFDSTGSTCYSMARGWRKVTADEANVERVADEIHDEVVEFDSSLAAVSFSEWRRVARAAINAIGGHDE